MRNLLSFIPDYLHSQHRLGYNRIASTGLCIRKAFTAAKFGINLYIETCFRYRH